MRPRSAALLLGVLFLGAVPLAAQRAWEFGAGGLVLLADPASAGAGVYGAVRLEGRLRLAALAVAGAENGAARARGEVLAHFLLAPAARRGAGAYGIGGVAFASGSRDRGYLVLGLGLEAAPATRSGWAVEAGVGGGVRIAAGYRWRWFRGRGA